MGRFEIRLLKSDRYGFVLKAGNGQVVLTSQTYANEVACENGIESVRKNSQDDKNFIRKEAKDGSYYFVLKASNGRIIGRGESYNMKASMENGVDSVKKNAPDADEVRVWEKDQVIDGGLNVRVSSYEIKDMPNKRELDIFSNLTKSLAELKKHIEMLEYEIEHIKNNQQ